MPESLPPLPPELVAHAHAGVSIQVGTCDAACVPDNVRGVGVRVWPGACQLTVLVPVATGAQSIANLEANRRIAVTLSDVLTHFTIQVKGTVRAMRPGDDDDRALAMRYRAAFAETLAETGLPRNLTLALGNWPVVAIDVDLAIVYEQTPGPSAGVQMPVAQVRS